MVAKTFRELTADTAPARARLVPTQLATGSTEPTKSTLAQFLAMAQVADLSDASVDGRALIAAANYAAMLNALQLKGADVASAATTDIGASTGQFIHITVSAGTINSFGTAAAGRVRMLRFAGSLTLTHNATSLILPSGGNISTAANDTATMVSEGGGNWRCTDYVRASGQALVSSTVGTVLDLGGHIETVANKTYVLMLKASRAYTVNSLTRDVMTSGSCTLAVQIDGVNVTSLSGLTANTTETETAATGANAVAAGATITLVASANSAALDLAYTLKLTLA